MSRLEGTSRSLAGPTPGPNSERPYLVRANANMRSATELGLSRCLARLQPGIPHKQAAKGGLMYIGLGTLLLVLLIVLLIVFVF